MTMIRVKFHGDVPLNHAPVWKDGKKFDPFNYKPDPIYLKSDPFNLKPDPIYLKADPLILKSDSI